MPHGANFRKLFSFPLIGRKLGVALGSWLCCRRQEGHGDENGQGRGTGKPQRRNGYDYKEWKAEEFMNSGKPTSGLSYERYMSFGKFSLGASYEWHGGSDTRANAAT